MYPELNSKSTMRFSVIPYECLITPYLCSHCFIILDGLIIACLPKPWFKYQTINSEQRYEKLPYVT